MSRRRRAEPTLGNLIRNLRRRVRLTQSQLAERLGYSGHEIVSRWENDREKPTIDTLVEIARVTNARDDELHELIMLERKVETHFPPYAITLPQLKSIAKDMANLPYPAYLLDYRGRFWAVNAGISQIVGVPLETIRAMLQIYQQISFLDVVFNRHLGFKAKLKNFDLLARQQIARYKMMNLYRRHEPFYRDILVRARAQLPEPEDYEQFKRLWHEVDESKFHELVTGIWVSVVLQHNASEQRYWLHVDPIFQLGKDLFVIVWYRPEDWRMLPAVPQEVLCLWDIVDVRQVFASEWQAS